MLLKYCKRLNFTNFIKCRNCSQQQVPVSHAAATLDLMELHGNWPSHEQREFLRDMRVISDFISVDEEQQLLAEIEPYMQRLRYESDHWDDAIHRYRETERKHWYPANRAVLERLRQVAFDAAEIMPFVHVLDLAADGLIKPHVDSTRFCGSTIAGMSLLTNCVMRLVRTDETKYQQHEEAYRSQPQSAAKDDNFYADLLLPRRSLYIMTRTARYNFTHEVLANGAAKLHGRDILKERRISIICRNAP